MMLPLRIILIIIVILIIVILIIVMLQIAILLPLMTGQHVIALPIAGSTVMSIPTRS